MQSIQRRTKSQAGQKEKVTTIHKPEAELRIEKDHAFDRFDRKAAERLDSDSAARRREDSIGSACSNHLSRTKRGVNHYGTTKEERITTALRGTRDDWGHTERVYYSV